MPAWTSSSLDTPAVRSTTRSKYRHACEVAGVRCPYAHVVRWEGPDRSTGAPGAPGGPGLAGARWLMDLRLRRDDLVLLAASADVLHGVVDAVRRLDGGHRPRGAVAAPAAVVAPRHRAGRPDEEQDVRDVIADDAIRPVLAICRAVPGREVSTWRAVLYGRGDVG